MKKAYLIVVVWLIIENSFSQINLNEFREFIADFPVRELPFTTSFDFEKASDFKTPLKPIPHPFCEKFIYNYGVKDNPDYCPKEKLDYLVYFARYDISSKYFIVHFGYFLDAGCGGKDYLMSYNHDGMLIDTLLIYGEGYWELPSVSKPNGETYALEGTVYKDSISTRYIQHIGMIINEDKRRKIYNRNFYSTYKINEEGKFQIIKELMEEGYEYLKN